jgi:hypothetical protein
MKDAKYIVDIMTDVVELMQATTEVNFLYGHPIEVVNTLKEWTKGREKKFSKFPLIVLFQDFEEVKGSHAAINSEVSLNLVLCTDTDPKYKSSERYEATFKPTLYPLYNLLLNKIETCGFFERNFDLIPHVKIDRVYYGSEGNNKNIFNDYIDAIEIKNLELKILNNFKNC